MTLAPLSRRTITPPANAEFSTLIDSDQAVVADRTMTLERDGPLRQPRGIGADDARRSTGISPRAPPASWTSSTWCRTPVISRLEVDARFLRAAGGPVPRHYTIPAHTRLTINADQIPGLEAAEIAGEFHGDNGRPLIVERAMYLSRPGEPWSAGLDGAGVTALGDRLVPGRGRDRLLQHLRAARQPGPTTAQVQLTFQRPERRVADRSGSTTCRRGARVTVDVTASHPELAADHDVDRHPLDQRRADRRRAGDVVAGARLARGPRHGGDHDHGHGVGGRRRR